MRRRRSLTKVCYSCVSKSCSAHPFDRKVEEPRRNSQSLVHFQRQIDWRSFWLWRLLELLAQCQPFGKHPDVSRANDSSDRSVPWSSPSHLYLDDCSQCRSPKTTDKQEAHRWRSPLDSDQLTCPPTWPMRKRVISVWEGVSFLTWYFVILYRSRSAKRFWKLTRINQAQSLCLGKHFPSG